MLYFEKEKEKEIKEHYLKDYLGVKYLFEGEPCFLTYDNYSNCLIEINELGEFDITKKSCLLEYTWENILAEIDSPESITEIKFLKDYDIIVKERQ